MAIKEFITMDGNAAAAHVAYAFSEIAAIYPITPSSTMAEKTDQWSSTGRRNIFGQTVSLVEMQSEAGAIAAVHGALQTGSLAVSFTSSQGLMLMIPVLHRIAGELLPCVLHVASRTVGTHAMSIFGDHSDVMNCRQTGFAMLCTGSVQEVMDLAGLAHLAAIHSRIPFLHFFDGFRTSHELCKIEKIDLEALASLLDKDALERFRAQALTPEHPRMRGTVQNGDVFFQIREASNRFYEALPDEVEKLMGEISTITGREYHLFNYYGDPEAEEVIIAMGSVSGCACDAVDWLCAHGRKAGFLQVHLYRPFSARHLKASLPSSVKRIAVLDRCKEPGSPGEPLYQDVCTALSGYPGDILIIGGRYGLSSKDTDASLIRDVFDNLHSPNPRNGFTIGIEDDVTMHSLPQGKKLDLDAHMLSCKFWGLGSDGTLGANRNTVDIINRTTDLYAQAYFEFDAKKSYGITKSHLRFSNTPIRTSSLVHQADIIACHNETFVGKYAMEEELKENGIFLLNCSWTADELEQRLPASLRRTLAQKHARLFIINASELAHELGLGLYVNNILQAAFFRISDILPLDKALSNMEEAIRRTYFSKGERIIEKNLAAIRAGIDHVHEIHVPDYWQHASDAPSPVMAELPPVVKNLLIPINAQKGDELPVSAFKGYEDGQMDMGLTAYEKRDIALRVPRWDAQTCIQCNKCSLVCPHAVIRPYLMTLEESAAAPSGLIHVPARGKAAREYEYTLQVSVMDCTGCGSCAQVCPASALSMIPRSSSTNTSEQWEYVLSLSEKPDLFDLFTVKGSQFRQPLLEFSAACAGCGETPYAKLLTQLFGPRVYWANATGCSQAWGAAMPGIPYTTNKNGKGPAWSNSLFENNAEFCLGMLLSERQQRTAEKIRVEELLKEFSQGPLADAARLWLSTFENFDESEKASENFIRALEQYPVPAAKHILQHKDHLSKKCFWMYGGDGWAYDIGFGGLDHVLASGEDINVFVVDTEEYSNTGGQSSKATPMGAVAKFCASGKKGHKKDLGGMFMSYGNIYIAQVSMGADPVQLMTALKEASSYHGPSLIIAYSPCRSHGIQLGMDHVQQEMKRATDAGYWPLYRFDPRKETPFILDSPEPSLEYLDFLRGEMRYASLEKTFPDEAISLFEKSRHNAQRRYARYRSQAARKNCR